MYKENALRIRNSRGCNINFEECEKLPAELNQLGKDNRFAILLWNSLTKIRNKTKENKFKTMFNSPSKPKVQNHRRKKLDMKFEERNMIITSSKSENYDTSLKGSVSGLNTWYSLLYFLQILYLLPFLSSNLIIEK